MYVDQKQLRGYLFIGYLLLNSCTPSKESLPNIVFFLVDDLG